jgi:hypothetical protein
MHALPNHLLWATAERNRRNVQVEAAAVQLDDRLVELQGALGAAGGSFTAFSDDGCDRVLDRLRAALVAASRMLAGGRDG